MSLKKLQDCPWCYSNRRLEVAGEYQEGPPYFVYCSGCECRGPVADTKTDARYLWNQKDEVCRCK